MRTSASPVIEQNIWVLGAAVATGAGGMIVVAPFAGDPPTLGIAAVDAVMLVALAVSTCAAWRVERT